LIGEAVMTWAHSLETVPLHQLLCISGALRQKALEFIGAQPFVTAVLQMSMAAVAAVVATRDVTEAEKGSETLTTIVEYGVEQEGAKAVGWFLGLNAREQLKIRTTGSGTLQGCAPEDRVLAAPAHGVDPLPLILDLLEKVEPGSKAALPKGPIMQVLRAVYAQVKDSAGALAWSASSVVDDKTLRSLLSTQRCTLENETEAAILMHRLMIEVWDGVKVRKATFAEIIEKMNLSPEDKTSILTRDVLTTSSQEATRRRLLQICCGRTIPLYTSAELQAYKALLPQLHTHTAVQEMHERYTLTNALITFSFSELSWLDALAPNAELKQRRNALRVRVHYDCLVSAHRNGDLRGSMEDWLAITKELSISQMSFESKKMIQDTVKEKCTPKARKRPVVTPASEQAQQPQLLQGASPSTSDAVDIAPGPIPAFITSVGEPPGPSSLPMLPKPQPLKLPPIPLGRADITVPGRNLGVNASRVYPAPFSDTDFRELEDVRNTLTNQVLCLSESDMDTQVRRWVSLELKQCVGQRTLIGAQERIRELVREVMPNWESHKSLDHVVRSMTKEQLSRLLKIMRISKH